jgi:hypothetical protein
VIHEIMKRDQHHQDQIQIRQCSAGWLHQCLIPEAWRMTQPCLSECEAPSTCKKKIKGIKKEEQRNERLTVDAS